MINKKYFNKQNGFTLVEVLISVGILVVISAMMSTFFIQGLRVWGLVTNQSDLRSTARNAMNYMTQELRNATFSSSASPPNLVIPNNNSVDFYLPRDGTVDTNDIIIDDFGITEWDTKKIQYQYISTVKQLWRLEEGGNHHILARDVALIEFEDHSINSSLDNAELKIILTLEKFTPRYGTESIALTSIVNLRN